MILRAVVVAAQGEPQEGIAILQQVTTQEYLRPVCSGGNTLKIQLFSSNETVTSNGTSC